MEKSKEQQQPPVKSKNLFMKFLPKAATSSVNFNNPTYSPNREKRSHAHRGFSGPMMFIPAEARRQTNDAVDTSFARREDPSSPKVSCLGQIKQKHKLNGAKRASSSKNKKKDDRENNSKVVGSNSDNKTSFGTSIFKRQKKKKNKSYSSPDDVEEEVGDGARKQTKTTVPSTLGQMKKFASTRDAFANFDWTTQITPVNTDNPDDRNCYSDDEMMQGEEDEGVDEFMIPFSAPMLVGAGGRDGKKKMELEPRKEINLWKRRTMVPPRPLNLNAPIRYR